MPRGLSIHIGLNKVDPTGYEGWDGTLSGCENDARAMKAIADGCGYETNCLLTADATCAAVTEAIGKAAQQLEAGDHLLLTYSGHGGQVPDENGDEEDGQDETWVLYDRMLIDDEIYAMWSQFAAGVRIFVLSDSCHSGTVVRAMLQTMRSATRDASALQSPKLALYQQMGQAMKATKALLPGLPQPASRYKMMPGDVQARSWERRKAAYATAQWVAGRPRDREVTASIILISGCQDNQLSMDGDTNGLFTEKLLATWGDGAFSGGHKAFHGAISKLMPATQTPNYYTAGMANPHFEDMRPFDLGTPSDLVSEPAATPAATTTPAAATPAAAEAGTPAVHGPAAAAQDEPPDFTVDRAGNPYYVFEIADSESLLDAPPSANDAHYYGTWADADQPARLTAEHFTLPEAAWRGFTEGEVETLYYRVGTTSSASAWDDYHTSPVETIRVTVSSRARSGPPPAKVARTRAGRGGPSSRDLI